MAWCISCSINLENNIFIKEILENNIKLPDCPSLFSERVECCSKSLPGRWTSNILIVLLYPAKILNWENNSHWNVTLLDVKGNLEKLLKDHETIPRQYLHETNIAFQESKGKRQLKHTRFYDIKNQEWK